MLFVIFDWVGYARRRTEMAVLDAGLVIGLMKQQKDHELPGILVARVRVGSSWRLSKEAGQMIAGVGGEIVAGNSDEFRCLSEQRVPELHMMEIRMTFKSNRINSVTGNSAWIQTSLTCIQTRLCSVIASQTNKKEFTTPIAPLWWHPMLATGPEAV